jgi:hypothetical protein
MAQTPVLSRPRSPSRTRRLLLPLLILIVGGALTIWATSRATKQAGQVEQLVHRLCEAAARGESVAGRLATSDPVMIYQLDRSLTGLFAGYPELLGEIAVEVSPGDSARLGTGTESLVPAAATHTVLIRLGDQPRVGLRIMYVDERDIRLVGCFQPQ